MKKLLLIILAIIPLFSASQSLSDNKDVKPTTDTVCNFFMQNSDLVWQRVFETQFNITEISEYLSTVKEFEVISVSDNRIVIKVDVWDIPFYAKYKLGTMDVAPLLKHQLKYSAMIDVKDSRYRVTVSKFWYYMPGFERFAGRMNGYLSDDILNGKGEFRKSSIRYIFPPLDIYFSDVFAIKNTIPPPTTEW